MTGRAPSDPSAAGTHPPDRRRALLQELTDERFGGPVIRADRPRYPFLPDTPANCALRRWRLLAKENE